MLVEHLIEPEFLVMVAENRRDYRDLLREFSLPSPRVVGDFPKLKNFRRKVLSAQPTESSEMAKTRLEELLKLLGERRVDRAHAYDGALDFLDNLQAAEGNHFNGTCLLREHPRHKVALKIISLAEFQEGMEPCASQISVKRTAGDICSALREFVRLSKSICLVDPYFSPKSTMWATFILLLEASINSTPGSKKVFEVLFDGSKKTAPSCAFLAKKLSEERPEITGSFARISFKDIRENGNSAIHNRYLLSELGGISLGHGFEESNDRERDEVTVLSGEVYNERYEEFAGLGGVDLEDQHNCEGGEV